MNIPGPFGLPLIGSAVLFIGKESSEYKKTCIAFPLLKLKNVHF